jgi:hypothetical protein
VARLRDERLGLDRGAPAGTRDVKRFAGDHGVSESYIRKLIRLAKLPTIRRRFRVYVPEGAVLPGRRWKT